MVGASLGMAGAFLAWQNRASKETEKPRSKTPPPSCGKERTMKRIALALAAIGLVGLLATTAAAHTPAVASLSTGVAVASVGHHPYGPGPGYWHGYYGHRGWYRPPVVVVAPAPVVVPVLPPPPVYGPYCYPPRSSIYYSSPRLSIGFGF